MPADGARKAIAVISQCGVCAAGGSGPSAPVVIRPARGGACGDGVIEDLVLVRGAGDAELAGRTAVLFPGAQQELVSPAAVAGSPGVAAAFFGVADADPKRGTGGIPAAAGW